MALTLSQASHEARTARWADSTRHMGFECSRNGRTAIYYFDRKGWCVGRECDGEVWLFEYPRSPRSL